jgi:hypothetical protein
MTGLTDTQRVARGTRAQRAIEEFVGPEFAHAREIYSARLAEVAATELHPTIRQEKITTLALAIRVLNEVESAITTVMRDGEHMRSLMISAEALENLSDARQRLIRIGGTPS